MVERISWTVALVALASTSAAMAGTNDEGHWVTTITGGTDVIAHGTLQEHADGSLAGLGSLDTANANAPATTDLRSLSMHDAYRMGPGFGMELGYMTDSSLEPFVKLEYSELRGRNERIGELSSPALLFPAGINSRFDDMHAWALNFGSRYFWNTGGTVQPYVAGFMGATRTEAMRTHLTVANMANLGEEELLPQQTRFDAGLESGLKFRLADNADLRVSVGANYVDARKKTTDAFTPVGVDAVQITEQRWSVPVDVGLNYRF
jgi:hypothetical protein